VRFLLSQKSFERFLRINSEERYHKKASANPMTVLLTPIKNAYSTARKVLTLQSMKLKHGLHTVGIGKGVGTIHLSSFSTAKDAQSILSAAEKIKKSQKKLNKPQHHTPKIQIKNADLRGINLSGSTMLEGANIKNTNLSGGSFVHSSFNHAHLDRVNLSKADLSDATLEKTRHLTN
jgi:hypothetical protein